jgi:hypothetical protein
MMRNANTRTSQAVISGSTWAAVLAGSLVLNLYVGVYDTVLIVPALWLLVESHGLTSRMKCLLTAIFIAPWISQTIAQRWGFQPYTLVLAATAILAQVAATFSESAANAAARSDLQSRQQRRCSGDSWSSV